VRHITPPLSTIELPGEEIGRHAGRMVVELLSDPHTQPESVLLPARLVARASTGAPRDGA
jgi:DNA-binding LacI/PurR family transcriptional regulator